MKKLYSLIKASMTEGMSLFRVSTKKKNVKTKSKSSATVYITKTGTKYHCDGCSYLSKSKIAISKTEAKAKGYTACSKCKPG